MDESLKQDIQKAVEHSGFPLEHYVYGILKKHKWSVITNRYYIDDIRGVEREIDIVAYKIYLDEIEKIQYITTLIISCKQSENKTWCFITRDIDNSDGNIDWTPLHFCTTDKRLEYMTNNHRESIINQYKSNIATRSLYRFDENVFAYEQLREACNDKEKKQKGNLIVCGNEDMYNSIITSIKAVGYEKRSRTEQYKQHKYKRYYTFHILSVFDGMMVKDYIDKDGNHDINPIQDIKYLNRHIINNKDNFYIVNFVNKTNFENIIKLFNYVHSENERTLPRLITEFYQNIFEDSKKVQELWNEFTSAILWFVKGSLLELDGNKQLSDFSLSCIYKKEDRKLEIGVDIPFILPSELEHLNQDTTLNSYVRKYLKSIFRYEENFTFTDGLPF